MKIFFLLVSVFSALATTAGAEEPRKLYKSQCILASPLGYYEPCEPGQTTANAASRCAQREAITECEVAANRFCHTLGFTYKYGMSKEIPGYQYCEVKVTVEGFK
ncbi:MAG: hypothetical protein IPM57_10390 [Oligoflexia bacterium]|nr:hypothetical protein [Oligoflexia bacterium]